VRLLTLLKVISATPIAVAAAQQPTPGATAPASANIVGTVYDSIRLRPLAGARVRVDSSALFATVDEEGRFHLEGIPAGRHDLRVEHPFLDTLAVNLRSEPQEFAAGGTTVHEFATPGPETLIEILCPAAWRARGPAALMGRVREADTGNPARGAKVSLVWYEVDVGTTVRRVPRVREAVVGADGTYRLCGLPAQLDGKVQVLRAPLTSGEIAVSFGQDVLGLRSMTIASPGAIVAVPAAPGDSGASVSRSQILGTARITGRVLNRAGRPLVGARVQLEGTTRATSTRGTGEFVLDSLPPGTQSLAVRLLGYAPVERAVDLSSRDASTVTITLEDFVPVLEAVRVTAQRERALEDVGFARRQRTGTGYYMDSEDIKNRNAQYFSDILRSAPGVRVAQVNGRQYLQNARDPMNGCVTVWVDGTQWQQMEPGDVDDFVKPHEIAAIEVYSATGTPAEYQGARGSGCSTVIAWTHRKLDRKR
jgi:hypothetical protein